MTIEQLFNLATYKLSQAQIKTSALDAEVLLHEAYLQAGQKIERTYLFQNPKLPVPKRIVKIFNTYLARRINHEPIAYILGYKEFYGLNFKVNPAVLIPRPETEILVDLAISEIKKKLICKNIIEVSDIGTGSGCIAIAVVESLKKKLSKIKIIATDISLESLFVASENIEHYRLSNHIKLKHGNLAEPIDQPQDLIIANLPYLNSDYKIVFADPVFQGLKYEPEISLSGGKAGIEIYQKFLTTVSSKIKPDGIILCEVGNDQIPPLNSIIRQNFKNAEIKIIKDYQDYDKFIKIAL